MEAIKDGYRLSSGREFYANNCILGLSPDDVVTIHEGYDGGHNVEEWTAAEREELASFMSALWLKWGYGGKA